MMAPPPWWLQPGAGRWLQPGAGRCAVGVAAREGRGGIEPFPCCSTPCWHHPHGGCSQAQAGGCSQAQAGAQWGLGREGAKAAKGPTAH
eukprot:jgi/Tetstr1/433225/TSEL_022513.t1